MRNSTKMGGSVKKKYQTGGSTGYMKPTKKVMTKTGPDAYDKAIAKNKATMDAIIKKEGVRKAVEKAKAPMPKKQSGGVIPASPVMTSPIQGRTGRRPIAGGNMAKGGQTFPDLNKDGKVTQADVLKGRGVYKKGGQAHPGFKAVQAKIAAKQGLSKKAAGAILATGTRKASAKAKAANPKLKRVKG
jgi:hypothetical protein